MDIREFETWVRRIRPSLQAAARRMQGLLFIGLVIHLLQKEDVPSLYQPLHKEPQHGYKQGGEHVQCLAIFQFEEGKS